MATVARTTRTSGPAADTARDPGLHNRRSGCPLHEVPFALHWRKARGLHNRRSGCPLHGIRCCPGCARCLRWIAASVARGYRALDPEPLDPEPLGIPSRGARRPAQSSARARAEHREDQP